MFSNLNPSYGLILADPPWKFEVYSDKGNGKSACNHYSVMDFEEVMQLPIKSLAEEHCTLILWTTWPMLFRAVILMKAWGFKYKSGGAWAKQSKTGQKWAFGTGYIFRDACEPFLAGTIGSPKRVSKSERNLIVAPVREHSRKPEDMHERLERLFPDVKKCELFGRESRSGWDVWGDENTKYD